MKSWADHCSSDEDSDDDGESVDLSRVLETRSIDTDLSYDNSTVGVTSPGTYDIDDSPPVPPPVDYGIVPPNAPNVAPFTAHIGNLSFGVKEGTDLGDEIEKLVTDRYNGEESVSVTEARVGVDRDTGKRRGYGYVEFDSLEELQILLNLNDGFSMVSGRLIRIDIAQPRRGQQQPMRSNNGNRRHPNSFDHGGGRGPRSNSRTRGHPNSIDNGGGRGPRSNSRNREQSNFSPEIDGNQFRGGFPKTGGSGSGGGVRPTLKLAPRSKPLMGAVSSGLSNIFGGAKPREENVRTRQQPNDVDKADVAGSGSGNTRKGEGRGVQDPRHNSGRAGRGGGRDGRTSGRGKGDAPGHGRGDTSSHGRGDASSHGRGDASSHGRGDRGDASGRGVHGAGGKKNKRGNARSRPTNEGENIWNKNPTPPSESAPSPIPPVEVSIPIDKKMVTSVKNSFAGLMFDSDSE